LRPRTSETITAERTAILAAHRLVSKLADASAVRRSPARAARGETVGEDAVVGCDARTQVAAAAGGPQRARMARARQVVGHHAGTAGERDQFEFAVAVDVVQGRCGEAAAP